MGFSFRRSIKLGPVRLNLSTRGVGVSAGVRGARVSVGPRGTYVTLGRGGFQYRAKLDNRLGGHGSSPQPAPAYSHQLPAQTQPYRSGEEHGYIHSAGVESLALISPDASLLEIQRRLSSFNWFVAYLLAAGVVVFVALVALPFLAAFILGVFAVGAAVPVYLKDSEYRTARLIYDVDDPAVLERLAMCNGAAEWLASAARISHVYYAVATDDWKTNAGASTLIQRTPTRVAPSALPGVELNIGVYSVPVGPQHLLFLPDRLIVRHGQNFAGVPYEELYAEGEATRFIEDGPVPPDTQIVDYTWQFVNKSGGPDLRFNNNRQLPVCRYGELTLATHSGMRVVLQTSNAEAALGAAQALSHLRARALKASQPVQPQPPRTITTASPDGRLLPQHSVAPALQPAQAVAVPNHDAHPSPNRLQVHRAAATLLRYIAAADRRIDDVEVQTAVAFLEALHATDLGERGDLAQQFRALRSDDLSADEAADLLIRDANQLLPHLLSTAHRLAEADGRVTPKERERLDWMEYRIGTGSTDVA